MVELDPDRPRRRQIAERIRDSIERGELAPGRRAPSELDLARRYGVTRDTVRAAYQDLEAEGLIILEQRRGFPRARYVRAVAELRGVGLAEGDSVTARMPTPAERRELDMGAGVPLLVVAHRDGTHDAYRADRTRLLK